MNIISQIFQPPIFIGVLAVLALAAAIVVFLSFRQDNKNKSLSVLLKEEISAKDELSKKVKILQDELAKVKGELALKTQMYDGLKGQYAELENDFEKLNQEFEKSSRPKPKEQSQKAGESPARADNPDQTVTNLIKSLHAIQSQSQAPQKK